MTFDCAVGAEFAGRPHVGRVAGVDRCSLSQVDIRRTYYMNGDQLAQGEPSLGSEAGVASMVASSILESSAPKRVPSDSVNSRYPEAGRG